MLVRGAQPACSKKADSAAQPAVEPRGWANQRPRREAEQALRNTVVAFAHWAKLRGYTKCETAAGLGIPSRTLYRWQRQRSSPLRPRGRKPRCCSDEERRAVVATLVKLGPCTGMPTLIAHHPQIARAELREIKRDYRRSWRIKNTYPMTRLFWTAPGTVWAMDFTMPESLIDGKFVRVLVVRRASPVDWRESGAWRSGRRASAAKASGYTLLALPCTGEDSDTVLSGLQSLFELHGAPLVIKSDNGSAFAETRVQALLAEKNVLQLFSPPYYPRYNVTPVRWTGVSAKLCVAAGVSAPIKERRIGELKNRTKYLAELNLRPEAWSSSDLQNAVHIANEIIRPWGWRKPTRAEVWNARTSITDEQRKNLAELRAVLRLQRSRNSAELCRAAGASAPTHGPNRTVADEVRDQPITHEAAFRARSATDRSEATAWLRKGTAGGRSTPAPGSGQSALETLSKHELASLERHSIEGALEQLGFLCYQERRYTPPIKL